RAAPALLAAAGPLGDDPDDARPRPGAGARARRAARRGAAERRPRGRRRGAEVDGTRPTLRGVAARAPAGRGRPGAVPQGRAADPGNRPAHRLPPVLGRRLASVGDRRLFLVGRLGGFERRLVGDDLALAALLRAVERLV